MESALELFMSPSPFLFCLLPLLLLFFITFKTAAAFLKSSSNSSNKLPKSYPIIGSYFAIQKNQNRGTQWTSDIVRSLPNLTFTLHRPLGRRYVFTANPFNVQHILKTRFDIYQKGDALRTTLSDILGDGIFTADGESWKLQRRVSSHEFNRKSLRKFVETVVDAELLDRLVPILETAAANKTVLDLQDILKRFAFDNICNIAFGFDPACLSLSPSLSQTTKFVVVFEEAVRICSQRFESFHPLIWKIKRALNIGSEKRLKAAVDQVRGFAKNIIKEKKKELRENSSLESVDLLSRFLCSGDYGEDFIIDIVISFIHAGHDTTSAALTWFFWLLYGKPEVEEEILKEVSENSEAAVYDEVKEMPYTHASLCESMRLYPPVPVDTKEAQVNDVLPDGTFVKKGTRVKYHVYAMGRVESYWGADWAEFRPERWLKRDTASANWRFVARDPYSYPVFQAGPRICLGKEMAFLQMKRMVAGILRQFRVVPALEKSVKPVFVAHLTSKMKGGFPVRIEKRDDES